MLSLDMTGCQCQSRKSAKGRHIIIFKSDGTPLYNTESGLELLIPEEYQVKLMDYSRTPISETLDLGNTPILTTFENARFFQIFCFCFTQFKTKADKK